MITKMKKLMMMVHHSDLDVVVGELRALGVIQLDSGEVLTDGNLDQHYSDRKKVDKALEIALQYKDISTEFQVKDDLFEGESTSSLADAILHWEKLFTQKAAEIDELSAQIAIDQFWGNLNPLRRIHLEQLGLSFKCFKAKAKQLEGFDLGETIVQVVQRDKVNVSFILVGKDLPDTIPFEEEQVSKVGAEALAIEMGKLQAEKQAVVSKLAFLSTFTSELLENQATLDNQISMLEAQKSFALHADGAILSVVGWVPERASEKVAAYLATKSVAWKLSNPITSDVVPVELQNTAFNRLFEPITRIFQLPHYFEFDLTPFIAVFYPIFFAYCLGDAGYGVLFTVLALIGYYTFFRETKNLAILGIILGVGTTVMGIVKSGSVFGIPLTATSDLAFFGFLSQFVFITDDQRFVMNAFNVAIMIGVVQIFLAVGIAIYKKFTREGFLPALSPFGKLLVMLGVIILFLVDVQEVASLQSMVPIAKIALWVGIVMFLVFFDMNFNFLKRVGSGILPLFFIFSNMLGDILSYVRLFALGVASAVLGLVVNQLGMQMIDAGWWGWIVGPLFLILGHALNMGLAVLGAFVHPLRLTFVEFYNNAHFEGGGKPYKPFAKVEAVLT